MEVKGIIRGSGNFSSTTTPDFIEEDMNTMELRRGPWTVEEDIALINFISSHGEGRWNSLARSAGLKRTGKSCRLRWLNYLRPDVRRGNITLEEQLLILELHSRLGNRWSKIAQHLPGRTDNEIKNYWRTRVQKQAKQLKCDVNSKQFKDAMRYLWMPRLVERVQAANSTPSNSVLCTAANHALPIYNEPTAMIGNEFSGAQVTPSYTPENSSTAASSDSFGTSQVSPASDLTDHYNIPVKCNPDQDNYFQANQSMVYPHDQDTDYFNQELDLQGIDRNYNQWLLDSGDTPDNLWSVEDIWFIQ